MKMTHLLKFKKRLLITYVTNKPLSIINGEEVTPYSSHC